MKRANNRQITSMKTLATLLAIAAISAAAHAADNARTADHDYDAPAPGTYTLPVIKPAADGTLLDSTGKPVHLADLTRGRITVMSFIYTRCAAAKACPYATGVLMQLHRASAQDTSLAKELRLVSMSFDPANDTPERMAAYSTLAECPTAAPWHFVTTRSQAELQPILTAYDQAVDKKKNPLDPTGPLNHTLRVFLIDHAGNIRNIYSSGTLDPRLVLADVRTLMMEAAQAGANPLALGSRRTEATR
jgi:cytochrome oxidase Cu insertion factor (SCO1/SenC/PrrC family)